VRRAALALGVVAALLLGEGPARAEERLRVGSKRFPESYVLAEIAAEVMRGAGALTEHRQGLGGTAVVARAIEQGAIDVYPEYTGTIAEAMLGTSERPGLPEIRAALAARGLGVSDPLGFENTYALAVRRDDPATREVRRLSDLAPRAALRVALSHEFLGRQDGWPGLAARYGLGAITPRAIDHALGYPAIAGGAADVIEVYSTDGELGRHDLRSLDDDRGFFPRYEAVWIYRLDAGARAPRALGALLGLAGAIDTKAMIAMNARTEIEREEPAAVAASFVAARGGARVPAPRRRAPWLRGLGEVIRTEGPRHVGLVAVSLALAVLVGVPLGVIAERRRRVGAVVLGLTGVVQTVPSLALLCFLLPVLGVGEGSALAALFVYGLLPIVRSTIAGIEAVSPQLRESAMVLGLTPRQRLVHIELPLASPSILSGIRTSAVIGVGTATLAAFVGAGGFGAPISTGLSLDDTSIVLQGAVPAAALALLVEGAFVLLARLVVPRGLAIEAAARRIG
jgi:osmoprotectant transport system permease protein